MNCKAILLVTLNHIKKSYQRLSLPTLLFLCIGVAWLGFTAYQMVVPSKPAAPIIFRNATPSLTMGYYLNTLKPAFFYTYGDVLVVKSPVTVNALGIKENETKLLKVIRGKEGDTYIVTPKDLIIHGKSYPILYEDKEKHIPTLPHLKCGIFTVPKGHYLLLNDAEQSFDSRYIGPVDSKQVVASAHLLLAKDTLERWWMYVTSIPTEKKWHASPI